MATRSFDLVVSALALHWAADLPGALIQLRRALKPDGLLLAAMFGGATLAELRTVLIEAELAEEGGVSPRVSPTADLADAAALLQRAGFAMPVADSRHDHRHLSRPAGADARPARHGRDQRAGGAPRERPCAAPPSPAPRAIYAERFGDADGRIPATFEIIYLTGWAPDAGQPKPLRPGSAARRLADALGTIEFSAGDIATPGHRT